MTINKVPIIESTEFDVVCAYAVSEVENVDPDIQAVCAKPCCIAINSVPIVIPIASDTC
jgi:hypothetical protein